MRYSNPPISANNPFHKLFALIEIALIETTIISNPFQPKNVRTNRDLCYEVNCSQITIKLSH